MMLQDTSEPEDIFRLMKQSIQVVRTPLNQSDRADYYWVKRDGKSEQAERKKSAELLGSLDNCERELRDYYNSADKTNLVWEGIITPFRLSLGQAKKVSVKDMIAPGCLFSYNLTPDGFIYGEQIHDGEQHGKYRLPAVRVAEFRAWCYQLMEAGICIINTMNTTDTANTLVTMWNSGHKEEHHTLNRYYRPRVQIKGLNPHVQALINLSSAYKLSIGEVRAEALVKKFKTLYRITESLAPDLYPVLGKKLADEFMEKITKEWKHETK